MILTYSPSAPVRERPPNSEKAKVPFDLIPETIAPKVST